MFNRSLQMKLVKNKKSDKRAEDETSVPTIDYAQVREAGKDATIAAGSLLATYMILDTLRQVTVAIVKAKV